MTDLNEAHMAAEQNSGEGHSSPLKRFLPLIAIALLLVVFFATGLHKYFTLSALAEHQAALTGFAAENTLLAMAAVIGVYAAATAISFPGASVLTILAGFILGTWYGGFSVIIGATIGATVIFLAGRQAAGDILAKRGGDMVAKLERGFAENALNYLFILRLVPAFPFWLVNLAASAFQVRTRDYVIATFFGIMPGTLVYASVGAGLGSITESESIGIEILLQPSVFGPIIGLAALSLLPILVKRLKKEERASS